MHLLLSLLFIIIISVGQDSAGAKLSQRALVPGNGIQFPEVEPQGNSSYFEKNKEQRCWLGYVFSPCHLIIEEYTMFQAISSTTWEHDRATKKKLSHTKECWAIKNNHFARWCLHWNTWSAVDITSNNSAQGRWHTIRVSVRSLKVFSQHNCMSLRAKLVEIWDLIWKNEKERFLSKTLAIFCTIFSVRRMSRLQLSLQTI